MPRGGRGPSHRLEPGPDLGSHMAAAIAAGGDDGDSWPDRGDQDPLGALTGSPLGRPRKRLRSLPRSVVSRCPERTVEGLAPGEPGRARRQLARSDGSGDPRHQLALDVVDSGASDGCRLRERRDTTLPEGTWYLH